jgi:NAD(P)-dependent dehydrogenase (short-subunit alcohol dehydrogenase family)
MTDTILVSGAGSGIGRAIALDYDRTRPGTHIILLGRREAPLLETRQLMKRAKDVTIATASQSDQSALHAALAKLDLPGRNLTAVIANAGVGGENRYGASDRWGEIINTNLTGTYYLIQECLPALLAAKQKPRHVVIVASILARLGVPGYSAYCASKAGLLGLMRSLAAEHAKAGVYVNAVLPGWVNTDMARQGIEQFAKHIGKPYEQALAMQMGPVPTGKMSEPAEVATVVSYLTSNAQSSFTGQCFDINNGALMP